MTFEREGKAGRWPDETQSPMSDGFMTAAEDGEPEQVCERCTPRGFSSDGSWFCCRNTTKQTKTRIGLPPSIYGQEPSRIS